MSGRRSVATIFLAVLLVGAGAILGASLTQGQEPEGAQDTTAALDASFTYQGRLTLDGAAVDDSCDFDFALFDDPTGGNQIGDTQTLAGVAVEDGSFIVTLNDAGQFGPDAFNGEARWLDISVQCNADDDVASLGRQPITAVPYAIYALESASSTSAASVPWDGITDIPADIADGDDDTTYSAGSGLALNGTEFSAQGSPYDNVVVVAKNGGDFSHIQAALDSIDDAGADNGYLVWVAPGVYEEQVTMTEHVDIAGAGEKATTIRWVGGSQSPDDGTASATVITAPHSELRSLAVESDGTGQSHATAIHASHATGSARITHVTATVTGASDRNTGVYNDAPFTRIKDATIAAVAGTIGSNHGIYNAGESLTLTNSAVSATGVAIENTGIFNGGEAAHITGVTITVSNTLQDGVGLRNEEVGGAHIDTTSISVSSEESGSSNRGVVDALSQSNLLNVTIVASGPDSRAVLSFGGSTEGFSTNIHNSRLKGDTYSVYSGPLASVHVATSQLNGPADRDELAGLTCIHSYDGDFDDLVSC